MNVAIVGNSSALLRRELGSRIDSCDRIVRINSFRIEGYEKHVGSRIDIVGTGRFATVSRQDPMTIRAATEVWMKRPWSYCRRDTGTQQVVAHFSIPEHKLRYPTADVYWGLAKRLVRMTNRTRRWWQIPYVAEKPPGMWQSVRHRVPPYPLVPSTGVVMIEMTLDVFKDADVYLLGFDQLRGGHYWEPGAQPLPAHPWDAERRLIEGRVRSGELRWLE